MNENKQEVVEEKVENTEELSQEFVDKKTKKGPIHKIINIIAWMVLIFIVISAVMGYNDFQHISKNEEPRIAKEEKTYTKDDNKVTVYSSIVYKIVKVENTKGTSIQLKPFFMSDL